MTLETRGIAREPSHTPGGSGVANPLVEIRTLTVQRDLQACVALQREIWGDDFADIVPASVLKISTYVGGIVAGAFDAGGSLLGFVYGITGVERAGGPIVHWSHMLGVTGDAQRQGIGRALKEYQRAELRKLGVSEISWTFDPLVARNAHFNFNVLKVRAKKYVAHMYGEGTSPLHRGIGTDRLIVSWAVGSDVVSEPRDAGSNGETLRIEVPRDIGALQASNMPRAREWRERTRLEFQRALSDGYAVDGFALNGDSGSYLLTR